MKKTKTLTRLLVALFVMMPLISCTSTTKQSGFLGEYYDNMGPGPKGGAKLRWIKSGVDFTKYDKIMIDNIIFFFAEDSAYKGIDPDVFEELESIFKEEIVKAFEDRYPVVTAPGPGVLKLTIAITDIKQSNPVTSTVSSIMPIGLAGSVLKKGSTGSWVGSGSTTAELIVRDAVTNEVIAVAKDTQTAGFSERFSRFASAKNAFKFWAERMRKFADNVHDQKN